AFWNGLIFYHPAESRIETFRYSNGLISTSPTASSGIVYGTSHGATVSISSNGTLDGIAWDIQVIKNQPNAPATLHAYEANNVAHEVWNSGMLSRDHAGPGIKFSVPTIANGHVYVGTG